MPQPMNDIRLPEDEVKPEVSVPDRYEPDLLEISQPPLAMRFKRWLKIHKKWTLLTITLILIVIIFSVPFSRYRLSGLFLKKDFSFKVVDTTTGLPVSGATVQAGKLSARTDADGRATLSLPVGERTININKTYYRAGTFESLVPILGEKDKPTFSLRATGRQVKISVRNLISKQSLPGVDIEVAGISATTDKEGSALVVLPPGIAKQSAALSLDGYNDAKLTVSVSEQKIAENNFYMTPVGKVYYLVDKAGRLDILKSNLDGSSPEIVVAGTGSEVPDETYLSHSTDWKYLALIAKRGSGPAKLYVINTADDDLLTMDEGNVSFTPVGWSGDHFIYKSDQAQIVEGKYDQVTLKSYDATTGRLVSIDQTSTQPINSNTFLQSTISNVYLVDGNILYTKFWDRFGYSDPTSDLSGKTEYFYMTRPDGSDRKTLKSFKATDYQWAIGKLYQPGRIHYQLGGFDADGKRKAYVYYDYLSGQLSQNKSMSESEFNKPAPTYFISPSADKYSWSQSQGSLTQLYLSAGQNLDPEKVSVPTDFAAAGWYGSYLLVTNDNVLYIVGTGGGTPVKIADYQPAAVY